MAVKLPELCEPLFQYVCQLNRIGRLKQAGKTAQSYGLERTRGRLEAILEDMKSRAASDPRLSDQYAKVELVLLFFVDFMVRMSRLDFANDWTELAAERGEFAVLEETLADPSEAASERLAVFYACMGLGFTGIYAGQPETLRKLMGQCFVRVRQWLRAEETPRISPDAYEHTDARDFVTSAGTKLFGMALALVVLVVVLVITTFIAYDMAQGELSSALTGINKQPKPQIAQQADASVPKTSEKAK